MKLPGSPTDLIELLFFVGFTKTFVGVYTGDNTVFEIYEHETLGKFRVSYRCTDNGIPISGSLVVTREKTVTG